MAVFGLTVSESIIAVAQSSSDGIREATIIGTPSGGNSSLMNTVVGITSLSDFKSKFPQASLADKNAVATVFNNNPGSILSYFPAFKSGESGSGDAAIVAHMQAGIDVLDKRQDLDLRYTLAPQMEALTAQADRTATYTALHNMCVKKDWLLFINSATSVDTKPEAQAERALYSSPLGHASYFWGAYRNSNNDICSIAPYVVAIAQKRSSEDGLFKPPAGAKYPLVGSKELLYAVTAESDYNELRDNGINVMQTIPKYGDCMWGSRTLSSDRNLLSINTRMAISVVVKRLEQALIPLMFESYDPGGATGRELRRVIESVMNAAYQDGAFDGATPEESYKIVEQEILTSRSTGTTQTPIPAGTVGTINPATTPPTNEEAAKKKLYTIQRIYARFVGATEQVEVRLFHTEDPAAFAA